MQQLARNRRHARVYFNEVLDSDGLTELELFVWLLLVSEMDSENMAVLRPSRRAAFIHKHSLTRQSFSRVIKKLNDKGFIKSDGYNEYLVNSKYVERK